MDGALDLAARLDALQRDVDTKLGEAKVGSLYLLPRKVQRGVESDDLHR